MYTQVVYGRYATREYVVGKEDNLEVGTRMVSCAPKLACFLMRHGKRTSPLAFPRQNVSRAAVEGAFLEAQGSETVSYRAANLS